jgi:signal transduction histidine kinase
MRTRTRLLLCALVGVLYALGALFPFWFFDDPASGAAFFPPAGLTVAALLLTPRRWWPGLLAAVAIAEVSVDLSHHQTVTMAIGFAAANVAEPLAGALLLLAVTRRVGPTTRGYLVHFVVCAVVIGPIVGATLGAGVATWFGNAAFPATLGRWWIGDALGVLVVATPILAWNRRLSVDAAAGLPEDLAIAGVAAAATILPALFWHHGSVTYLVLPVLMWAALRGGALGVGVSGIAVAFSVDWVILTNRSNTLFAAHDAERTLINVQLFIGVTLLAALAFAVEVGERTRAERVLRNAEMQRVRDQLAGLDAAGGERRRIAREAHDIVGHALNIMILSTGAARRVLDSNPPAAQELLVTAEEVGREAFRDLDVALGLVDQTPDLAPQHGLADLDELLDRLTRAGLDIDFHVEGEPRALPRLVDWSAYRIIQEALTNVVKHSASARTRIDVCFAPYSLHLTIADEGAADAGPVGLNGRHGRGLVGMRERVAVLGGRIETGPAPGRGFRVNVELPTERN